MKQVSTLLLCVVAVGPQLARADDLLHGSRQCLVVTTKSWAASTGEMHIFERDSDSENWRQRKPEIRVVVGASGLAEGGNSSFLMGGRIVPTFKFEGDRKAPAGIFPLSRVFGYSPRAETKMPYLHLTSTVLGIDDPNSRYYNQLIDASTVKDHDWRSAEVMRRHDNLYKWGIVVNYNVPVQRGRGSCIFLHVWRGPGKPTVGCTAMSEKNILEIVRWLDPGKNPVLIQFPMRHYELNQKQWNLPMLLATGPWLVR